MLPVRAMRLDVVNFCEYPPRPADVNRLLFQFSLGEQLGTQRFSFGYPNRFSILAPAKIVNP